MLAVDSSSSSSDSSFDESTSNVSSDSSNGTLSRSPSPVFRTSAKVRSSTHGRGNSIINRMKSISLNSELGDSNHTNDELPDLTAELSELVVDVSTPVPKVQLNPNMDVNDIPMEVITDPIFEDQTLETGPPIVEQVYCRTATDSTEAIAAGGDVPAPDIYFQPVLKHDREIIAKYVGIHMPTDVVGPIFDGLGKLCGHKFSVEVAKADGACFFNAISFLLTSRQNFDALLRKVLCDYMSNPENWHRIRPYIPPKFTTGKQYVDKRRIRLHHVWVREPEIFAMSQLLQVDIVVYARGKWERFPASGTSKRFTERAFYLSNPSGNMHYDPVVAMK